MDKTQRFHKAIQMLIAELESGGLNAAAMCQESLKAKSSVIDLRPIINDAAADLGIDEVIGYNGEWIIRVPFTSTVPLKPGETLYARWNPPMPVEHLIGHLRRWLLWVPIDKKSENDPFRRAHWFTSAVPKESFNASALNRAATTRGKVRKRKPSQGHPTYSVLDALKYEAWEDYHPYWRDKLDEEKSD